MMNNVRIHRLFNGDPTGVVSSHHVSTARGLLRVLGGYRLDEGWGVRITLEPGVAAAMGAWQVMEQWWVAVPGRDPIQVEVLK